MVPTPVALGLVLCDVVIVEEKTKKVSLIGTFARIKANEFPATPLPFSVRAVLTDGSGDATIKLGVTAILFGSILAEGGINQGGTRPARVLAGHPLGVGAGPADPYEWHHAPSA